MKRYMLAEAIVIIISLYVNQTIKLYVLNLYSEVRQLFFSNLEK